MQTLRTPDSRHPADNSSPTPPPSHSHAALSPPPPPRHTSNYGGRLMLYATHPGAGCLVELLAAAAVWPVHAGLPASACSPACAPAAPSQHLGRHRQPLLPRCAALCQRELVELRLLVLLQGVGLGVAAASGSGKCSGDPSKQACAPGMHAAQRQVQWGPLQASLCARPAWRSAASAVGAPPSKPVRQACTALGRAAVPHQECLQRHERARRQAVPAGVQQGRVWVGVFRHEQRQACDPSPRQG
jgi:hypothetical protein